MREKTSANFITLLLWILLNSVVPGCLLSTSKHLVVVWVSAPQIYMHQKLNKNKKVTLAWTKRAPRSRSLEFFTVLHYFRTLECEGFDKQHPSCFPECTLIPEKRIIVIIAQVMNFPKRKMQCVTEEGKTIKQEAS